jgi:hypothetical protein
MSISYLPALQPVLDVCTPVLQAGDLAGYGGQVGLEGGQEGFERVQQFHASLGCRVSVHTFG